METGERINKYLSEAGVCSRREADRQLEQGNVWVNGFPAGVGDRVMPGDEVVFCGQPVKKEERRVLLLVNKPAGIVCTAQKREKNNIVDFLAYPIRVYPVGRLDKDSEGLLLMTNEGSLVNQILRARNFHEKEYLVTVNRPVTDAFLRGMAGGVPILDTMTRKCEVERTGKRSFRIVLTQGLNRQIRRMCEYFDYRVVSLKRVRIMNLQLGDLKTGSYREATEEEMRQLQALLGKTSCPEGKKEEKKEEKKSRAAAKGKGRHGSEKKD